MFHVEQSDSIPPQNDIRIKQDRQNGPNAMVRVLWTWLCLNTLEDRHGAAQLLLFGIADAL